MFKAKSLYHLIVYSIFFIVILISFFTFIIIDNAHEELQQKIETQKQDYTNSQKELLKSDILSTINFINFYHNKYKNEKNEKDIKLEVLNALYQIQHNNNINEYLSTTIMEI
jgi:predicted Holliday junction resolvase-like endonuclease